MEKNKLVTLEQYCSNCDRDACDHLLSSYLGGKDIKIADYGTHLRFYSETISTFSEQEEKDLDKAVKDYYEFFKES